MIKTTANIYWAKNIHQWCCFILDLAMLCAFLKNPCMFKENRLPAMHISTITKKTKTLISWSNSLGVCDGKERPSNEILTNCLNDQHISNHKNPWTWIHLHSCKLFFWGGIFPYAEVLLLTLAKTVPSNHNPETSLCKNECFSPSSSQNPAFSFCIVICTISYLYSG